MSTDQQPSETSWDEAVAHGEPAAIVAELIGALSRSGAAFAASARRVARRVADGGALRLSASLVASLRAGRSLREDLLRLFTEVLEAATTTAGEQETTAGSSPDSYTSEVHTAPDDAPDVELQTLSDLISQGVARAQAEGRVHPGRSSDATAWALTSLLMTLVMRSREGEDTQRLIDAAKLAIVDLLGPGDD